MPNKYTDPWRELAAAVINQAIEDWKKYKNTSRRNELLDFFRSGWFDELSELSGLDSRYILEKLKVPKSMVNE